MMTDRHQNGRSVSLSEVQAFHLFSRHVWSTCSNHSNEEGQDTSPSRLIAKIPETLIFSTGSARRWLFTSNHTGEILKRRTEHLQRPGEFFKVVKKNAANRDASLQSGQEKTIAVGWFLSSQDGQVSSQLLEERELQRLLHIPPKELIAIQPFLGSHTANGSGIFEVSITAGGASASYERTLTGIGITTNSARKGVKSSNIEAISPFTITLPTPFEIVNLGKENVSMTGPEDIINSIIQRTKSTNQRSNSSEEIINELRPLDTPGISLDYTLRDMNLQSMKDSVNINLFKFSTIATSSFIHNLLSRVAQHVRLHLQNSLRLPILELSLQFVFPYDSVPTPLSYAACPTFPTIIRARNAVIRVPNNLFDTPLDSRIFLDGEIPTLPFGMTWEEDLMMKRSTLGGLSNYESIKKTRPKSGTKKVTIKDKRTTRELEAQARRLASRGDVPTVTLATSEEIKYLQSSAPPEPRRSSTFIAADQANLSAAAQSTVPRPIRSKPPTYFQSNDDFAVPHTFFSDTNAANYSSMTEKQEAPTEAAPVHVDMNTRISEAEKFMNHSHPQNLRMTQFLASQKVSRSNAGEEDTSNRVSTLRLPTTASATPFEYSGACGIGREASEELLKFLPLRRPISAPHIFRQVTNQATKGDDSFDMDGLSPRDNQRDTQINFKSVRLTGRPQCCGDYCNFINTVKQLRDVRCISATSSPVRGARTTAPNKQSTEKQPISTMTLPLKSILLAREEVSWVGCRLDGDVSDTTGQLHVDVALSNGDDSQLLSYFAQKHTDRVVTQCRQMASSTLQLTPVNLSIESAEQAFLRLQREIYALSVHSPAYCQVSPARFYTAVLLCDTCYQVYIHLDKRRYELLRESTRNNVTVPKHTSKPRPKSSGAMRPVGNTSRLRCTQVVNENRREEGYSTAALQRNESRSRTVSLAAPDRATTIF